MPTPEHDRACKRAKRLLDQWKKRLPWLWEFEGTVTAVPEQEGDFEMSVAYTCYSFTADLQVQPSAGLLSAELFERTVLHEMAHVLLHEMGMAHRDATGHEDSPAFFNAEERVCWRIARVLQELVR